MDFNKRTERHRRWMSSGAGWWPLVIAVIIAVGLAVLFRAANGQSYTRNGQATPTPLTISRGNTRVIDGDTIVQGTTHYRLFGIDAPELGQTCKDGWPAGDKARGFLRVLIEGALVVCDNRGPDKYGRTLAVCMANGADLNQAMVRTGNAMAYSAYSRAYVLDEIAARNAKAGMWAHICQAPWDYRHQHAGKSGR